MSSINTISIDKLARLIGTPECPVLIDVQTDEDFAADPRLIPGAVRRPFRTVVRMGAGVRGPLRRRHLPEGPEAQPGRRRLAAARGHSRGRRSKAARWPGRQAGLPMVPEAKLPPRDAQGRTVWVTRARPKVDRIACPWLIRRFVDPRGRVPVRRTRPRCRASPSASGQRRSTSRARTCSGAIAASCAPSTSWSRSSASRPSRSSGSPPSCAAPTPPGPTSRPRRRACSPPRSASRACMPTTSSSSRPAWRSTTPSTAGAATPPTRPTTGPSRKPGER